MLFITVVHRKQDAWPTCTGNMCPREAFPTVMHVQHKTGTSDKQGQRAKGILKDLQPEKFLKYLNFMTDVTNVLSTLSKTFHSDQLHVCITDTDH